MTEVLIEQFTAHLKAYRISGAKIRINTETPNDVLYIADGTVVGKSKHNNGEDKYWIYTEESDEV